MKIAFSNSGKETSLLDLYVQGELQGRVGFPPTPVAEKRFVTVETTIKHVTNLITLAEITASKVDVDFIDVLPIGRNYSKLSQGFLELEKKVSG